MKLDELINLFLMTLISDHNALCKRFQKAQEFFDNQNISISEKQAQEQNIILLMKQLNASVKMIRNAGYNISDTEAIQGINFDKE